MPSLIGGGDEMGLRVRETEWAATPIGARQDWPEALVCLVRMILG